MSEISAPRKMEYSSSCHFSLRSSLGGRYMGFHSQRILGQAGFSGVTFAAKILRCELPRYWLPRAEFAANVIPCSAPLTYVLVMVYGLGSGCYFL